MYLRYHNLLIAQALWQAHYQVLPIISLKGFRKLNVNTGIVIKKYVKLVGLNIRIATIFFNI